MRKKEVKIIKKEERSRDTKGYNIEYKDIV